MGVEYEEEEMNKTAYHSRSSSMMLGIYHAHPLYMAFEKYYNLHSELSHDDTHLGSPLHRICFKTVVGREG